MKSVELFTDGACLGNPGPGGWAALLKYGGHEKLLIGSEAQTTNNRMEISAVMMGLRALKQPCRVHIISDSRYVIDAFEQGWLLNWRQNGWRTANRKPVANQDLWEDLDRELKKHQVKWTWVKGHDGHEENERVDQAARDAALAVQSQLRG
ncbi:MAG: ribonuclease HI [Oligoflexus sp.]